MRFTKTFQDDFNNNVNGMLMNVGGAEAAYSHMYLLAGPQSNYIGLYSLNLRKMAFDTRIAEGRLSTFIEQFEELGFVKFDRKTGVIWVIDAAERNVGELKGPADGKKGDLKIALVQKEFDAVRAEAVELRAEFYARYSEALKLKAVRSSAAVTTKAPAALASVPVPAPAAEIDVQPADIDISLRVRSDYNACLSALKNLRLDQRKEYPSSQDKLFAENVAIVTAEWGHQLAANCFISALREGDLNLVAAVQRLEGETETADV
jgi:hypothetical protein